MAKRERRARAEEYGQHRRRIGVHSRQLDGRPKAQPRRPIRVRHEKPPFDKMQGNPMIKYFYKRV